MTLPESLARKALPCSHAANISHACHSCRTRPAVEAVLREMVEACAELADENPFNGYGDKYIARAIRALLTKETP